MRLRNSEYDLLRRVHQELVSLGREEFASKLQDMITRFEVTREKVRAHNRDINRKNREAGYTWRRPENRPKKSKYYAPGQENINNAGVSDQN